jgi:4-amino-4-deoxy-L-arabinose transferase-like glycosyltransferase
MKRWLALLILWYALATLPYLTNYPRLSAAQTGIAAPAYKLAAQGVYGNDLYRGFYRTERYNYEYLPLYPLFVALFYKLLGLGVWQGRLVSFFSGLLVVSLTYQLGRKLFQPKVGLWAAAVLCLLPIAVPGESAGLLYPGAIPLLDMARALRYDVMTAVWFLAACLLFLRTVAKDPRVILALRLGSGQVHRGGIPGSSKECGIPHFVRNDNGVGRYGLELGYFGVGLLVGLATLTHIYGAFILALFVLWLWQRQGWSLLRQRILYLLLAGWLLALLPWLIYILQDLSAYLGQQLRHQTRFHLFELHFYIDNLLREPWRYLKLIGRFRPPIIWPRPGFWLMLMTVTVANAALWRRRHEANARFLLLALPTLALLLALLISFKRYVYIILILPFLALQVGYGLSVCEEWVRQRPFFWRLLFWLFVAAALIEGIMVTAQNLQAAAATTPYYELTEQIRASLPKQARLLALHEYWLGLADYDFYTIDLALVLSDPAYGYEPTPSIEQVVAQIAPDTVIIPDTLLKAYETPESLPSVALAQKLQALDAYLLQQCQLAREIATADYGLIFIFVCAP